jgi:IS30 family transposase
MNYSQLTQEQRYQIYALLKTGCKPTQIAEIVGVHKSTISRELKRNKGKRGYRPQQAQRIAERRHNRAKKRLRPEDWAIIDGWGNNR